MSAEGRQQHGIHVKPVLGVLAGLAVAIVLVCGAMYALSMLWNAPLAGANAPMNIAIPAPTLQSAPQYDSARLLSEKQRALEQYEWLDRERGVGRIPIEEAMRVRAGTSVRAAPPASASESPRTPAVVQRTGNLLPLETRFRDESGRDVPLARYFGDAPVVLVFGYYRCPNLCTTLMEGVLMALSAAGLDGSTYRVVAVSVDPREGPGDAAVKARAYRSAYANARVELLTGEADEIRRLATAGGVRYAYDSTVDQYAHPLALLVVSPEARISRYFAGVQFDPSQLRLALVEASAGRIGSITDRIFLRCAHYDPRTGRYTVAAMTFVRGGCLLVGGGVAGVVWNRRRKKRWNR